MGRGTLDRLSEPFFSTKPVGEGIGLGLATVYGLANQAGGRLAVDSELGRESTFKIHVPAMTGSPAGGAADGPRQLRETHEPRIGGSETVLFCEDDRTRISSPSARSSWVARPTCSSAKWQPPPFPVKPGLGGSYASVRAVTAARQDSSGFSKTICPNRRISSAANTSNIRPLNALRFCAHQIHELA